MSTNFLNRRMDLHHRVDSEINYLTMDTSYPVKLAGKVLKIFTAFNIYNRGKWILRNSENETILEVDANNVLDFADRVINDNIGEAKPYPLESDVFKANDYVMVIVDFDNKKLLMCSETNFYKLITSNDDVGNLKMFVIDGSTEEEGFDFPIDESAFDKAVEYENKNGKYALVKNTEDEVVYEKPELANDDSDFFRNKIPVAKVDNMDINKLNTSVQTLIYPSITKDDEYIDNGSIHCIDKLSAYMIINGKFNKSFIDTYCFTNSELEATEFFKHIPEESKKIYNNITDKNNFYYLLISISKNRFNSDMYDKSLKFIPIRKSDNTFAAYFNLPNHGFMVKGRNVCLPVDTDIRNNMVGCDYPITSGYQVFHHASTVNIIINNDKTISGGDIHNYEMVRQPIKIDDSKQYDGGVTNGLSTEDFYKSKSNNMEIIERFIDFFGNAYTGNSSADRKNEFKLATGQFLESTFNNIHYYIRLNADNEEEKICPICNVIVYPNYYHNSIFEKIDGEYNTNTLSNCTTKFYYSNKSKDYFRDVQVVYNSFNQSNMSPIAVQDKSFDNLKIQMNDTTFKYHIDTEVVYTKNGMLCQPNKYLCRGDTYDGLTTLMTFINIMEVVNINDNKEKNNFIAEIHRNQLLVCKRVKYATCSGTSEVTKNTLFKEADGGTGSGNLYICETISDSEKYYHQLYTIVRDNDATGELTEEIHGDKYQIVTVNTRNNFKRIPQHNKSVTEDIFHQYMYYIDNDKNVHRIKYYYKNSYSGDGHADVNELYDYITDNIIITDINNSEITIKDCDSNIEDIYRKAWINLTCDENKPTTSSSLVLTQLKDFLSQKVSNWMKICLKVDAVYQISPSTYRPQDVYTIVNHESDSLSNTNTYNLCVGIDEKIIYPGVRQGNVNAFKLSDIMQNDYYKIEEDNLVPYLSNTQDINGGLVFNIKSYVNYIKSQNFGDSGLKHWILSDYLNGYGIETDYTNSSIFNFYANALTRDLGIKGQSSYFKSVENGIINLFKKNDILNTTIIDCISNGKLKPFFFSITKESDGSTSISHNPINFFNTEYIKPNISPKNLFGFNESILYRVSVPEAEKYTIEDITDSYMAHEPIYINSVETGKRKILSPAIDNGDLYNNSIISINGNEGTIESDTITWKTLLQALNNNNDIDILSPALLNPKKILNQFFLESTQNINDNVSIEEDINNIVLVNIAKNNFDIFEDNGYTLKSPYINNIETIPDSGEYIGQLVRSNDKYYYWDNKWINLTNDQMNKIAAEYNHFGAYNTYSQYMKDNIAAFNDKYNLYDFNYGYGYQLCKGDKQPGLGETRVLNNRGVIVFVSEGGQSICNHGSGGERTNYQNTPSKIYPKRMYITKEGLLCTKEFYEANMDINSEGGMEYKILKFYDKIPSNVELVNGTYDLKSIILGMENLSYLDMIIPNNDDKYKKLNLPYYQNIGSIMNNVKIYGGHLSIFRYNSSKVYVEFTNKGNDIYITNKLDLAINDINSDTTIWTKKNSPRVYSEINENLDFDKDDFINTLSVMNPNSTLEITFPYSDIETLDNTNIVYAGAMIFEANSRANPDFNYNINVNLVCQDENKTNININSVRTDCAGMSEAVLRYLGYEVRHSPDTIGISVSDFHQMATDSQNIASIKDKSGTTSSNFKLIPYSKDNLLPGDFVIYSGRHIEQYVYTDINGVARGFSGGSSDSMSDSVSLAKYIADNKRMPQASSCSGARLSIDGLNIGLNSEMNSSDTDTIYQPDYVLRYSYVDGNSFLPYSLTDDGSLEPGGRLVIKALRPDENIITVDVEFTNYRDDKYIKHLILNKINDSNLSNYCNFKWLTEYINPNKLNSVMVNWTNETTSGEGDKKVTTPAKVDIIYGAASSELKEIHLTKETDKLIVFNGVENKDIDSRIVSLNAYSNIEPKISIINSASLNKLNSIRDSIALSNINIFTYINDKKVTYGLAFSNNEEKSNISLPIIIKYKRINPNIVDVDDK